MWQRLISKKIQKESAIYFLNIAIILLLYASWCCLTISYRSSFFIGISVILNLIALFIYSYINIWIIADKKVLVVRKCIFYINILTAVEGIILGTKLCLTSITIDKVLGLLFFLWGTLCSFMIYIWMRKEKQLIYKRLIKGFKYLLYKKKIFLLLFILILLCFGEDLYQFKWDGLLYYQTCQDLSLSSLSSLAIYGHIAQTYGFAITALAYIIGDVGVAMIVLNIALLVLSSIAFYGIIIKIIPDKNECLYIGAMAIYCFSPFYFGMVGYHNLDFYVQCLFPILLFFLLNRNWIMYTFIGMLFCFSKETAIIVYVGLFLGQVLVEYIRADKKSFLLEFKRIIFTTHYYLMAVPIVLWFITYLILGPWNAGEGGIAFDGAYIIEKIKVLYILNFNWIFTILLIIGVFFIVCKRISIRQIYWWIIPVVTAQICFTIFSCLFKTVNHPRYSDTSVVTLYIIGIYVLLCGMNRLICKYGVFLISILMLVSCYRTIDPLSNKVFNLVDIGERKMITTYDAILGDGMIYNNQMLGMEGVLCEAIENTINEDAILLISAINDSTYYFDGMADVQSVSETYRKQIQYWDSENKRRGFSVASNYEEYSVYYVSQNEKLKNIEELDGKIVSYIYIDEMYKDYAANMLQQIKIRDTYHYSYRGWILHQVIGEVKDNDVDI